MEKELSVEELETLAETDVGEVLRLTREFYGKSLEDVERALRIRSSQLGAIERGDVSKLPGRVYAIGFVRSYAEYLELDGDKVVYLFKSQYMNGQSKISLSFPIPVSETKIPTLWLVSGALVLASVFMLAWHQFNKPDRSIVQDVALLPEHIENHVNEEILIDALDKPLQEAAAQGQSGVVDDKVGAQSAEEPEVENMGGIQQTGIILKIIGNSWVEIKDGDGGIMVSRVLEKGEEYFVPDNPGLSMSLGNAANVEIIVEGRALKPLGKDGDVRNGIPLNTTYLKTLDFKDSEDGAYE
ncbi:MAG: DUF4115 domain-containing protein [Alphaproteobacteria bacterium]|nr:DUF4115 domain-containing protein [Alphaproteobacteria bacterium]